jgi:hypothetical protein
LNSRSHVTPRRMKYSTSWVSTANMGGQVMVIPADLMPVQTGLAAIYRY